MPVVDHPVHQSVKKTGKERNGCHNRKPYATGYFAPDRVYKDDGTYQTMLCRLPFKNSALCNYDLWHSDWGCLDCKWAGGQVPSAKDIFVDSVDTSKKCVEKTQKSIHEECND